MKQYRLLIALLGLILLACLSGVEAQYDFPQQAETASQTTLYPSVSIGYPIYYPSNYPYYYYNPSFYSSYLPYGYYGNPYYYGYGFDFYPYGTLGEELAWRMEAYNFLNAP